MTQPITHDATPEPARDSAQAHERALMRRAAAGELDAFESLYRLYHPRLKRFLLRMTRRPALAEEVLDDTMLVVWRRAASYRPEAKVSTWIFAIAYRQALKALHKVDDAVESNDAQIDEHAPGPDVGVQRAEWRARVGHALDRLSADHRAVIELTYYLGHACREIAEIMDCPVDTVKTRMFYARRKLRTLLAPVREEAT